MEYQAFKEIILGRRSVRQFTEQAVTDEQIHELIDCARYAPSDTNSQTWEFIAVVDREKIATIEQMTWEQLHKCAGQAKENGEAAERAGKLLVKAFGPYATAFSDAPALIICLATPYTSKFRDRIFEPIGLVDQDVWREEGIKSSCLAAQNLMLAAHAMGLATCPMSGPVMLAEKQLREFLKIDDAKEINLVIALGHPVSQPSTLPRKAVDEILTII